MLVEQYEERERCGRTVYVANVDERLEAADVRRFFSKFCGECMVCSEHDMSRLLLLCAVLNVWPRGVLLCMPACRPHIGHAPAAQHQGAYTDRFCGVCCRGVCVRCPGLERLSARLALHADPPGLDALI